MKDESNTAELPSQPERDYKGPDRRRHRVYVTRNTEYHFRDGFCVAVRDRKSGEFLHGHLALQRRVDGGLKFFENGGIAPNPGDPKPGESLYFATQGPDLVTSPLVGVERPSKEVSKAYPGVAVGKAGKAKGPSSKDR
jgi:hypothetical protein